MRIGIFTLSLAGGGAERVVSYLLDYCVNHQIEVHLILMNTTIKYVVAKTVKIHYLEKNKHNENSLIKALKIPFLSFKYAKLVKKLRLTHSLSFLTRPSLINVISSKCTIYDYKIIVNERSYPSLQYGNKDFRSVFNKFMISKLFRLANVVISNSKGSSQDLINNFNVPNTKMRVVYNPINLDNVQSILPIKNFFDKDSFNMITVGRLNEGKNHELLINAIKELGNPLIKLYILGDGPLKSYLEQLIIETGMTKQVTLLGFSNNPFEYLKASDLFIFGSNFEGFPNVLLEAMACSLPIISTNCDSGPSEIMGLKEEMNDLMQTDYGILVPIKNISLMSKAIQFMYLNKEFLEQYRSNCFRRVQSFDKERILNKYFDTIRSI